MCGSCSAGRRNGRSTCCPERRPRIVRVSARDPEQARRSGGVQVPDATLAAMPWPSRLGVLLAVALAAASTLAAAPSARAAVPRLGHVFLIVGENTSYEQIKARHAPFLTGTVKPRGAWVANDRSFAASSSLGEYVAMVSGQFTRCEAHNDLPDHCH